MRALVLSGLFAYFFRNHLFDINRCRMSAPDDAAFFVDKERARNAPDFVVLGGLAVPSALCPELQRRGEILVRDMLLYGSHQVIQTDADDGGLALPVFGMLRHKLLVVSHRFLAWGTP